ncbi:MAG: hypothetical protein QXG93_04685, partial [Nitrososphaerota archaeon]
GEVEVDEVYEAVGRKGLRGVVKPKRRGRGRLRGRSTEDKLPFFITKLPKPHEKSIKKKT